MTLQEFAKKLDGHEYGYPQFTDEELAIAKENGFVIVYGASDDLMEIDGAIRDEGGCFDGGTLKLNIADKRFVDYDTEESDDVIAIEACWCKAYDDKGRTIQWTYKTSIPHEMFMIYEDGEPYCLGLVFQIDALRKAGAGPKTVEIKLSKEEFEKLKSIKPVDRTVFVCDELKECFTVYNLIESERNEN